MFFFTSNFWRQSVFGRKSNLIGQSGRSSAGSLCCTMTGHRLIVGRWWVVQSAADSLRTADDRSWDNNQSSVATTGSLEGNLMVSDGFPSHRASNLESISMPWRLRFAHEGIRSTSIQHIGWCKWVGYPHHGFPGSHLDGYRVLAWLLWYCQWAKKHVPQSPGPNLSWCKRLCLAALNIVTDLYVADSGPRLNIKTVLSTYGDFHVKDKTAVRTSYL